MSNKSDLYYGLVKASSFTPERLEFPDAWVGHLPFASWLIGQIKPSIFVELGTHTGNSYFSFCQAVAENDLQTKCYAVDTWQGDEHAGLYDDRIFNDVSSFNRERFEGFSRLLRMTFDDALSYFSDESIDLLHIDGLHTYKAVMHDFETWLPKLKPGAVVLFHDTNVRERDFGVWKLFEELRLRYPHNLEFMHSNGLGVIQLNPAPPERLLLWLSNSEERQQVKAYFSALGQKQSYRFSCERKKEEIFELNEKISALLVSQHNQKSELIAANELIRATKRSTSWRITAPLRFVSSVARKIIRLPISLLLGMIGAISSKLEKQMRDCIKAALAFVRGGVIETNSESNISSYGNLVDLRNKFSQRDILRASLVDPNDVVEWPKIDVSIVTFNSSKWISGFIESIYALNYPADCLIIRFVDNSSVDDTFIKLQDAIICLQEKGYKASLIKRPNLGFGAGHSFAIQDGAAPFCLVTNIDLTFNPDSLRIVVANALQDDLKVASWEFRQKPYEHPKYYDPITGFTNWSSHACVLLRRSALEVVGCYDKSLFMYGEDVELSYRLRREGYLLRYCPSAVVWHYTYENAHQVKPVQYVGSIYSHLYIRLKYGTLTDILAIPFMVRDVLNSPEPYSGSRKDLKNNLLKLFASAPRALLSRKKSTARFSFHAWDYEYTRDGAFIELEPTPDSLPLVSIIIRTYRGRELYLQQAIVSALRQTWPNIEIIVVEDGGNSLENVVAEMAKSSKGKLRYLMSEEKGRSSSGNDGLRASLGRWCLFLDDDDYLLADHIEVLAAALARNPDAVASYSLAWEVVTDISHLADGVYYEQPPFTPSKYCQEFDFELLREDNYIPIQSILFERNLFIERGGMHEDIEFFEDWTLWVRYAFANKYIYIPKTTSAYRTPLDQRAMKHRHQKLLDAKTVARAKITEFIRSQTLS